jgi:agmatinase
LGVKYRHGTPFHRAIKEGPLDNAHSISASNRGSMYHPDEVKDSEDLGLKMITAE